jgi:hypothetical protein
MFTFIYWATSMPPTDLLLLCGYCFPPPAYALLFAAVALPTTHNLCRLRLCNKKSKQDDITINCCEPGKKRVVAWHFDWWPGEQTVMCVQKL